MSLGGELIFFLPSSHFSDETLLRGAIHRMYWSPRKWWIGHSANIRQERTLPTFANQWTRMSPMFRMFRTSRTSRTSNTSRTSRKFRNIKTFRTFSSEVQFTWFSSVQPRWTFVNSGQFFVFKLMSPQKFDSSKKLKKFWGKSGTQVLLTNVQNVQNS